MSDDRMTRKPFEPLGLRLRRFGLARVQRYLAWQTPTAPPPSWANAAVRRLIWQQPGSQAFYPAADDLDETFADYESDYAFEPPLDDGAPKPTPPDLAAILSGHAARLEAEGEPPRVSPFARSADAKPATKAPLQPPAARRETLLRRQPASRSHPQPQAPAERPAAADVQRAADRLSDHPADAEPPRRVPPRRGRSSVVEEITPSAPEPAYTLDSRFPNHAENVTFGVEAEAAADVLGDMHSFIPEPSRIEDAMDSDNEPGWHPPAVSLPPEPVRSRAQDSRPDQPVRPARRPLPEKPVDRPPAPHPAPLPRLEDDEPLADTELMTLPPTPPPSVPTRPLRTLGRPDGPLVSRQAADAPPRSAPQESETISGAEDRPFDSAQRSPHPGAAPVDAPDEDRTPPRASWQPEPTAPASDLLRAQGRWHHPDPTPVQRHPVESQPPPVADSAALTASGQSDRIGWTEVENASAALPPESASGWESVSIQREAIWENPTPNDAARPVWADSETPAEAGWQPVQRRTLTPPRAAVPPHMDSNWNDSEVSPELGQQTIWEQETGDYADFDESRPPDLFAALSDGGWPVMDSQADVASVDRVQRSAAVDAEVGMTQAKAAPNNEFPDTHSVPDAGLLALLGLPPDVPVQGAEIFKTRAESAAPPETPARKQPMQSSSVQRQPQPPVSSDQPTRLDRALAEAAETGTSDAAGGAGREQAGKDDQVNVDKLAQDVFNLLKERLRIEHERKTGRM